MRTQLVAAIRTISCCCEYLHKEMQKAASNVFTVHPVCFITPCKRCSPVVLAPLSIWLAVASLTSVNYRQAEQWKVLRLMYIYYYVYVYTCTYVYEYITRCTVGT